jgi:NAD(P)-dependent dehydrogenase (short-subunit alcohol dehydrogenase family)
MSEQQALAGQVAWVTGGGSGIGLAGAIELAKAGCRVVVSGRDAAKLDAAIADAEARGAPPGSIGAAPLDVADAGAVKRVATTIQDRYGQVDILVNSAGINFAKRFWGETDSATFGEVVAINLNGAAACTLAVLKGMQQRRRGTVINVASFVGWYLGYLTGPAYTASKAGMIALSHSFNIEEFVNGLRATALCPGRCDADPKAPGRAERRGEGAMPRKTTWPDDPLHRDAAARVHQFVSDHAGLNRSTSAGGPEAAKKWQVQSPATMPRRNLPVALARVGSPRRLGALPCAPRPATRPGNAKCCSPRPRAARRRRREAGAGRDRSP